MADSGIVAGMVSIVGTFGSIYLKDYLDRRRAGLIDPRVGLSAAPLASQTPAAAPAQSASPATSPDAPAEQAPAPPPFAAATTAQPPAQPVTLDQYPHRENYGSRFMFMLARYKKSLIIAATGLIFGWFGAEDFAAISATSGDDVWGISEIVIALVIYIGPVVLFILEKRYLSKWNYSGYVVNCATLFAAFGVGLSFNNDVATGIGMIIGMLLVGLLPSAALGFLAGKIFYKPKAI